MDFEIKQEIKNWMPPITADEYQILEGQLLRDGCTHPLILWSGILIDGHNRHKICTEHDIPFKTETMHFDTDNDAREWVIRNQIGRRNIAPGARVEMVRWMKDRVASKAKERQAAYHGNQYESAVPQKSAEVQKGETRDTLAKLANVSHDTFSKAEYVLDHGTEEQRGRLRSGESKVHTLHNEVRLDEARAQGITQKKCSICGQEKPIEEFEGGRNRCNTCKSAKPEAKPVKPSLESINKIRLDMYNTSKVMVYEIEDMVQEMNSFMEYFCQNSLECMEEHENLLTDPENCKKIMAILLPAEIAIEKMKQKLKGNTL